MDFEDYSDVELRALEYWERGHRRQTKLRRAVMRELRRRQCEPWKHYMTDTLYGQAPGLRGAAAALKHERESG